VINAKLELVKHIEGRKVKYVCILYRPDYNTERVIEGALVDVLPLLDFDYDEGFGGQEIFGFIWYADGTWSEREEYDGSEWWDHKVCPEIPEKKEN
jgi:hypothetical protein